MGWVVAPLFGDWWPQRPEKNAAIIDLLIFVGREPGFCLTFTYHTIHWFSSVKDEPEAMMLYPKKDTQRNDGRESARTASEVWHRRFLSHLGAARLWQVWF